MEIGRLSVMGPSEPHLSTRLKVEQSVQLSHWLSLQNLNSESKVVTANSARGTATITTRIHQRGSRMIKVTIGEAERYLDAATPSWIQDQLGSRRDAGVNACVKVVIRYGALNMVLSTANCSCSARSGPGRRPNPQEQEIFDLWEKRGLNEPSFHVGQLIAFLNQLRGLIPKAA